MRGLGCCWLILCIVVAICPTRARAEDKALARQLYEQGTQHYDLNEFREALGAFKDAYRNYNDPAFLFNIAHCHRALGNSAEAIQFYKSYLRKLPDAPNAAEVRRIIATLENAPAARKPAVAETATSKHDPVDSPAGPVTSPPPPTRASTASTEPSLASAPSSATVAVTASMPDRAAKRPLAKRPWFWLTLGGAAVVVAGGVVLGVTLGARKVNPAATYGVIDGN